MASQVNGLSSTMGKTLVKASNSGLLQSTRIARVTGLLSRPKTANPTTGWSRMKSMESRYVPLDMHHGGMSPSSMYLSNVKNSSLDKNALKTPPLPDGAAILNYLSRNSTKESVPKHIAPTKSRSLGRCNTPKGAGAAVKRQADREDEISLDTDHKPTISVEKKSDKIIQSVSYRADNVFDKNIEEVANELERIEPLTVQNKVNITANKSESTAIVESSSPSETSSTESFQSAESFEQTSNVKTVEFTKPQESLAETMNEDGSILFGINNPTAKTSDLSTSLQRTVDINLNNFDSKKIDSKNKLSMDINVVVSLKNPEPVKKTEIGFQEKVEENTDRKVASKDKLDLVSVKPKINIDTGTGVLTQKDLTDEIGKVYNFFKNNGKLETVPKLTNHSSSFDIFQNFDKIKNLYLNTLKCVKAFKELRLSTIENPSSYESAGQQLESDKCNNDVQGANDQIKSNNSFKYPIDFRRDHYTNTKKDNGRLLGTSQRPQLVNVRMYSSEVKQTDCEKAKKLPCLQSSEISKGDKNAAASAKSVCDKLCMPCCKPARDPPLCFYPYHKPPCKKEKPPRPAFSECKMMFELKQVVACECVRPRATSCKKSPESDTCAKR